MAVYSTKLRGWFKTKSSMNRAVAGVNRWRRNAPYKSGRKTNVVTYGNNKKFMIQSSATGDKWSVTQREFEETKRKYPGDWGRV